MNPVHPFPALSIDGLTYQFHGTFDGVDIYTDDDPGMKMGILFVGRDLKGAPSYVFPHATWFMKQSYPDMHKWIPESAYLAAKAIISLMS